MILHRSANQNPQANKHAPVLKKRISTHKTPAIEKWHHHIRDLEKNKTLSNLTDLKFIETQQASN